MTQSDNRLQQALSKIQEKAQSRNKQRLGTLKLWQSHIEALSKPKAKPFLKRYEEAQEFSSMQFEQENKH